MKKQWCSAMEVEKLPADHYAVFKNVTKYSIWGTRGFVVYYWIKFEGVLISEKLHWTKKTIANIENIFRKI